MERVKAWEMLEDPEIGGSLNMVQFHRLLLRAGWSPEDADEAAKQRGWERLQAGEAM